MEDIALNHMRYGNGGQPSCLWEKSKTIPAAKGHSSQQMGAPRG
jgi:hypothetical protein